MYKPFLKSVHKTNPHTKINQNMKTEGLHTYRIYTHQTDFRSLTFSWKATRAQLTIFSITGGRVGAGFVDTQTQLTQGGNGSLLDAHSWVVHQLQHLCVHRLQVGQEGKAVSHKTPTIKAVSHKHQQSKLYHTKHQQPKLYHTNTNNQKHKPVVTPLCTPSSGRAGRQSCVTQNTKQLQHLCLHHLQVLCHTNTNNQNINQL